MTSKHIYAINHASSIHFLSVCRYNKILSTRVKQLLSVEEANIYTYTDTHAQSDLKWRPCIIPPPPPFSSHHQSLLNLKSSLLGCSFCMNLFSVAQFGWSATLTIPQGLRVRARAQCFQGAWKRRRGLGGWEALRWSRQARGQTWAPVLP